MCQAKRAIICAAQLVKDYLSMIVQDLRQFIDLLEKILSNNLCRRTDQSNSRDY